MSADLHAFLTASANNMIAKAAAFQARHDADRASGLAVISARPFAVVNPSMLMAIDSDGAAYKAQPIEPHLCDMVCFDRATAQRMVDQLTGDGWQVVARRDLAQLCADSCRDMAEAIRAGL